MDIISLRKLLEMGLYLRRALSNEVIIHGKIDKFKLYEEELSHS